jgi:hypothetical protein
LPLPERFIFSQNKLQDYVDCARRFQLRHLLMQPWPALITGSPADLEEHLERGARLHHLAHQHIIGIEPKLLAASVHDPILSGWWQTFLTHPPRDLPQTMQRAEVVVAAPLAGRRLLARFDLIAVDPGQRMAIVDWKTSNSRPSRPVLARRLQTLVYRFAAVEAGATLFGGRLPSPAQVEMVYWFASQNGATERFGYDDTQHAAAREYLAGLIRETDARHEETWPLTSDERQCRFCNYRSLCERNVEPGFPEELEFDIEPALPELSLEEIDEVEF